MNEYDLNEFERSKNTSFNGRADLSHSWKDSAREIFDDVTRIYRKEGELVKTELSEKASEVKTGMGSIVSGGVIMLVAAHVLAAAAVFAINLFLPLWASALIVAAVCFVIGFSMVNSGKSKMEADNLIPNHSIGALKEMKNRLEGRYHEFKRH
ncbi:MAG TPA: phage holin family protein [Bacteriovoracaceae bacterium]|nr:phage holin family protein [Bacteriovoracaceae bacterium]